MDRVNRLLWTCVAVLLTAAGALGIAAGRGYLRGVDPHSALLSRSWLRLWHGWGVWAWTGLVIVGLILCWLGVRLLRAELRSGGRRAVPSDLVLQPHHDQATGTTRVRGPALAHATERALQQHPAVEQARVGLFGDVEHPEMRARLDTTPDTDLRAVGEHVSHTLLQLTATSGLQPRPIRITVRPSGDTVPRVH
jgi:hypothetical protein